MENKNRGTFSNFGFLMAAVGSAVGLGNLWKFPYVAGKNGGGIFVFIYLIIILTIGFACTLGEMTIGRKTRLNPIGAYEKLAKKFKFVGFIGVLVPFLIVTYYNIIGGWVLKYLFTYLTGGGHSIFADPEGWFGGFISSSAEPVIWTAVFIILNLLIVSMGVEKGIEKASKVMMPALFVLILLTAIRSITLPGAAEGIKFFLKPDFSALTWDTVSIALGQCFFSLSLGMGIMITYGSYMSKESSIERNAIIVPMLDTLISLIAGLAILPAVFAFGFEPGEGPGLIFITLPAVFEQMPLGHVIAIVFFLLVLFAALSSSMSLFETTVSYFIDNRGMKRKNATIMITLVTFLIAIPESLSLGVWGTSFFGMAFFDFIGYIAENLLMPLAGLFMCIVLGYIYPLDETIKEVTNDGKYAFRLRGYWTVLIKYVAPVVIFFIWLNSSGLLKLIMK